MVGFVVRVGVGVAVGVRLGVRGVGVVVGAGVGVVGKCIGVGVGVGLGGRVRTGRVSLLHSNLTGRCSWRPKKSPKKGSLNP